MDQHQTQRTGGYMVFTLITIIVWSFLRISCLVQANQMHVEAIYSGQYLYIVKAAWLFGFWLMISIPIWMNLISTPSAQNVVLRLRNSNYCRMSSYLLAAYWIGNTVYFIFNQKGFNGSFRDLNYLSQSMDILFLWLGGILLYLSCYVQFSRKGKTVCILMGVSLIFPTAYTLFIFCFGNM